MRKLVRLLSSSIIFCSSSRPFDDPINSDDSLLKLPAVDHKCIQMYLYQWLISHLNLHKSFILWVFYQMQSLSRAKGSKPTSSLDNRNAVLPATLFYEWSTLKQYFPSPPPPQVKSRKPRVILYGTVKICEDIFPAREEYIGTERSYRTIPVAINVMENGVANKLGTSRNPLSLLNLIDFRDHREYLFFLFLSISDYVRVLAYRALGEKIYSV